MPARKNETVEDGYTKLESPTGAVTTVPDSIKDTLVEGGYKPVK